MQISLSIDGWDGALDRDEQRVWLGCTTLQPLFVNLTRVEAPVAVHI